jgi:glutamine cyclotransferase
MEASYTKHFDADRNWGALVFGQQENLSVIRVFDMNHLFNFTDYQIPYDVTLLGKNSLVVERNLAYLAMGSSGLVVFNLESGNIVNTFKTDSDTANAVFVEKDYIYLAYGSAGLFILDAATIENLGNWRYEGSCNFVFVDHETVFVANGDGEGFLVLQKN